MVVLVSAGTLISHEKLLLQINMERELGNMDYKLGQVGMKSRRNRSGSNSGSMLKVLNVCYSVLSLSPGLHSFSVVGKQHHPTERRRMGWGWGRWRGHASPLLPARIAHQLQVSRTRRLDACGRNENAPRRLTAVRLLPFQEASGRRGHPFMFPVPPGAVQPVADPRLPEQQEDPDHPRQRSGPIGELRSNDPNVWGGSMWHGPVTESALTRLLPCSCWRCRTCSRRGTSSTWCSPPWWNCRSSTRRRTRFSTSTWCPPSARPPQCWGWWVCVWLTVCQLTPNLIFYII